MKGQKSACMRAGCSETGSLFKSGLLYRHVLSVIRCKHRPAVLHAFCSAYVYNNLSLYDETTCQALCDFPVFSTQLSQSPGTVFPERQRRFITFFSLSLCLQSDPARVVDMPSVIYVAISLPGFIRCPVDANPPVTMVKWKKDGLPLRIDKVSRGSIHKCVMSSVFHFIRSISVRSSAF